jgi:hypothetical protein
MRAARSTTWLLVRMYPSGAITTPLPAPRSSGMPPRLSRSGAGRARPTLTTAGPTRSTAVTTAWE